MATVKADVIADCACGEAVAWLPSAAGRPYPVEIRKGVERDKSGKKSAVVVTNDFHYCGLYSGLAQFVLRAIDRSDAKQLRIRLLTATRKPVVLSWRAGKAIVHVSDGGPYGDSAYYGSIDLESGGFRIRDGSLEGLLDLLEALDKRPAEAARAYGEATGQCCFCDRRLDDERSIVVGYGGRCAQKYGLPWGEDGENSTRRARRTNRAVRLENE